MNDLPNSSALRDLRGLPLAELPGDPAAAATAARVTGQADGEAGFAVGAFNSYI